MPGTSRFRAPSVCFRARDQGQETRCVYLRPYRGPNTRRAVVTVGQHARKRGLPTLSVTGSDIGDGSVAIGDGSVPIPWHPVRSVALRRTRGAPSRTGGTPSRTGGTPSPIRG